MKRTTKIAVGVALIVVFGAIVLYYFLYKKGGLDQDKLLKKGSVGNEVQELQKRLNRDNLAGLSTNGYFDGRTESELVAYISTPKTTLREYTAKSLLIKKQKPSTKELPSMAGDETIQSV